MAELTVPSSIKEWQTAAAKMGLNMSDTMHKSRPYKSASQMLKDQYLLLHVLWESREPAALDSSKYMSDKYEAAQIFLQSSESWKAYLETLPGRKETRTPRPKNIGLFTLVRWHQLAITEIDVDNIGETSSITPEKPLLERLQSSERSNATDPYSTPRKFRQKAPLNYGVMMQTPSNIDTPASTWSMTNEARNDDTAVARDEQIVNTALILLLDALFLGHQGIKVETTLERKRFKFSNLWTATTDGYIRSFNDSEKVHAIFEVKPFMRERKPEQIRHQEAGEMVCWIYSDPYASGTLHISDRLQGKWENCRLLISQDRNELWITLAMYNDNYLHYLHKGTHTNSFMCMREYGPFILSDKDSMKRFATFIVAFALNQSSQSPSPPPPPTQKPKTPTPPDRKKPQTSLPYQKPAPSTNPLSQPTSSTTPGARQEPGFDQLSARVQGMNLYGSTSQGQSSASALTPVTPPRAAQTRTETPQAPKRTVEHTKSPKQHHGLGSLFGKNKEREERK